MSARLKWIRASEITSSGARSCFCTRQTSQQWKFLRKGLGCIPARQECWRGLARRFTPAALMRKRLGGFAKLLIFKPGVLLPLFFLGKNKNARQRFFPSGR